MFIYRLQPTSKGQKLMPRWDIATGFIIRAPNEMQARLAASAQSGDEGQMFWVKSKLSVCEAVSPDFPSDLPREVLLRSFVNG